MPPASGSAPVAASSPTPHGARPLDATALTSRALDREMAGDRAGALADLRAALAVETDPLKIWGIEQLLRRLEANR